jgi:RNA polymerase sigma-70 factor (ECF subfamily)
MHTTQPTLLQKLREPNRPDAWQRFVDLYTPLLLTWARTLGLRGADAADLVQDVFVTLVQQLPTFRYDPARNNFRGWLRTVCWNRWRDRQRLRGAHVRQADAAELAGLVASEDRDPFWEQEHQAFLIRQALQTLRDLRREFEPQTVDLCWEVVVNDRPPGEVARQFGVSVNAVYIARLRVLRRLRQEVADFLE